MRLLSRLLLALILLLTCAPWSALAQDLDWREERTERFVILYVAGHEGHAEQYAAFIDPLYDEVSALFGHQIDVPVTLRLYPTLESYYEVNPMARRMLGIVAHADFRHHELVVIVSETAQQTADEVQNNVRHELAHLTVAALSENRLNVGFHEGIAQYIEHPTGVLEDKVAFLRLALQNGGLLTWSELEDRNAVYARPEVSYPQTLSIAAFLVERYSFPRLRDFVSLSARSSGYRSALQRAFGLSPDELEEQWLAWLPSYLAGGYQRNALSDYDLTRAMALLEQGRYADAQVELETAIEWLQSTDNPELLQEAQSLLARSAEGQSAETLALQARATLQAGDYRGAADLIVQAQQVYARLGDTRQDQVLQLYAERVERGLRAQEQLSQAQALAHELRYPQARALADQASLGYSALGDQTGLSNARALRVFLDERQTVVGGLLLLLGLGGIAISLIRRMSVAELEAW